MGIRMPRPAGRREPFGLVRLHQAADRERRRGCDPTRSSDDHHRDGRPHVPGDDVRRCRCAQGEVDEVAGEPVGRLLDRSTGLLGVLDRLDDPPECGVAAESDRADLQGAGLVECR
jgi:hypothetical protein